MAALPLTMESPEEVHQRGMNVAPKEARSLWALVELDSEAFQELHRFRATLRVRGYQKKAGVTWQFDGQEYPLDSEDRKGPLKPGERIWVPLIVAQYGVRNTAAWTYETDISGNVINKQDFLYGQQIPLVRIVEIRNPGDFGKQMQLQQAAPRLSPCPFCEGEFEPQMLGQHILEDHSGQISEQHRERVSKAERGRAKEWAKRTANPASTHVPEGEDEKGDPEGT